MTEPTFLQVIDIALLFYLAHFVALKAVRIGRESSFGRALAAWNWTLVVFFIWIASARFMPRELYVASAMLIRAMLVVVVTWGELEFRRAKRSAVVRCEPECDPERDQQ